MSLFRSRFQIQVCGIVLSLDQGLFVLDCFCVLWHAFLLLALQRSLLALACPVQKNGAYATKQWVTGVDGMDGWHEWPFFRISFGDGEERYTYFVQ